MRKDTCVLFIFGRFLAGVSIGIFSYLVPLYCNYYIVREIVPTEISSHLISLHSVMIALGHFVGYVLSLVSTETHMAYISFCLPALALGIQAFLLYFFYEFETPSFLWFKNRRPEVTSNQALNIISRLYLINEPNSDNSFELESEVSDYPILSFNDVIHDQLLRRSLLNCIALGAFTNLVGVNTFLIYFPSYARNISDLSVKYQTLIIYASYFCLSIFIFLFIKRNNLP